MTGLTAAIHDGTDLTVRGYLLRWLAPWEDRGGISYQQRAEVDPTHEARVRDAEARLQECEAMTLAQAAALEQACHEESVLFWEEQEAKRRTVLARYEATLAELQAWSPPPALEAIRQGMMRHLNEGIDRDCASPDPRPEGPMDAAAFRVEEIHFARGNLALLTGRYENHLLDIAQHNALAEALALALTELP